MNMIQRYVVVMMACITISICGADKAPTRLKSVPSLSAHLNNFQDPKLQHGLIQNNSMMHIKSSVDKEVIGKTLFDRLKGYEIERNMLKPTAVNNKKDLSDYIGADITRIERSRKILYQYAKVVKANKEMKPELVAVCEKHDKQLSQLNVEIAELYNECGSCFPRTNSAVYNKMKALCAMRKHRLHGDFGLHDKLTATDITSDVVDAADSFLTVDELYAQAMQKYIAGLDYQEQSGCTCIVS